MHYNTGTATYCKKQCHSRTSEMLNHRMRTAVHRNAATFKSIPTFNHIIDDISNSIYRCDKQTYTPTHGQY